MEISPNGGGSSSKGRRQTSDQPPASNPDSNQSKGQKTVRVDDLDEYQDIPLENFPEGTNR
jgi:hypothetical protein